MLLKTSRSKRIKLLIEKYFPTFCYVWREYFSGWHLPFYFLNQPRWPPLNRKAIELEITEFCNLSCVSCECCFEQAPSQSFMSRDQISRFVEESIGLGWKWDVIKLRGGEPTLHPELFEVIELLERYHKVNPDCKFHILTNGFSEETKWILTKMPKWISVDNSEKKILSKTTIGKLRHDSFNIAPIDLWIYKLADYTKGCWRPSHCGMALSRYGYYPCAAGIHVSRVFGVEVGIKKLGQVNEERFLKVLNSLCRYCGHYKQPNDSTARNVISKSWRDAFNKYKESKPNLSLY